MISLKKIFYLLNKKEKSFFFASSFFTFLNIILEMFSFALIIPVFNIIFLNQYPNIPYFNFLFDGNFLLITENGKILILLLFILIFIFKAILLILCSFFIIKFFHFLCLRISNDLFNLYLSQNYVFFLEKRSDNILQKVTNDINGLKVFFTSLQIVFLEFLFLFFLFIFLLYSNYKIFLFCFFTFSTIFFVYNFFIKKRIISWSKINNQAVGELNQLIIEGRQGIKDIFIYKLKDVFINKFNTISRSITEGSFKLEFVNHTNRLWMEAIAVTSITLPLIYLLFIGQSPNLLVPIFALFSIAIFRAAPSVNRILNFYNNIKYFKPSFENIYNDFITLKKIRSSQNLLNFKNSLEFNNVSFSYSSNKVPVVKNINFKIFKGECIAITGENGSGKSTLLNLISGLLEATEGKIVLDEFQNIFQLRDAWLNNIGYVQQNIFLIDSSIKYNITLHEDNKINNNLLKEIYNKLSLDKIFANLPSKLDTKVGNNGALLSGGQRQMISVARSIYKNTNIIILDEANSALDKDYKKILKEFILSYKSLKTFIIVTHDINYFKDCFDKIYFIKDKKIFLET
jgi:ABC-type multidrug transport system fused ATPase/permease subunit